MYCNRCGNQVQDDARFCDNCGNDMNGNGGQVYNVDNVNQKPVVDNGGFGWGLLGCCLPIVGLILFLVWKDQKPKSAKAAGIGALISVILVVLFYGFVFIAGIMGASASTMYYY